MEREEIKGGGPVVFKKGWNGRKLKEVSMYSSRGFVTGSTIFAVLPVISIHITLSHSLITSLTQSLYSFSTHTIF